MNAAEQLGWTLDDLHERIGACEAFIDAVAEFDPNDDERWTAAASLTFLRIADELLSLGKDFRPPVPAPMLRRIRRLDEKLDDEDATRAANRLRTWLQRQESDLPPLPSLDTAPLGQPLADDEEEADEEVADNLVALPRGAHPGNEKEKLRGLRAERWVAIPARGEVRKRVRALREALGGLSLILNVANGEDDLPFGPLDRRRLALVTQAARHTLGGPLAEQGLLQAVKENAAIIERQALSQDARVTAKRARIALEIVLSDLR